MDKDENVETGRLNHKRKKKSKKENEKEKMRERKRKKVFDLVGKIKLQIFDLLFIFGWRIKSFFSVNHFSSPKQFPTLSFFHYSPNNSSRTCRRENCNCNKATKIFQGPVANAIKLLQACIYESVITGLFFTSYVAINIV